MKNNVSQLIIYRLNINTLTDEINYLRKNGFLNNNIMIDKKIFFENNFNLFLLENLMLKYIKEGMIKHLKTIT